MRLELLELPSWLKVYKTLTGPTPVSRRAVTTFGSVAIARLKSGSRIFKISNPQIVVPMQISTPFEKKCGYIPLSNREN